MSINSALLKSIQVMVDKAVSNIPFDQTRQTQILSNNGDGTYVIRLDGIVYDRVPSYPKIKTLEMETIVKVKIPSNQPNQMYIIAPEDALDFLDIYYPIGSYYTTNNPNFNPNVEWGGLWELETKQNDFIIEEGISGRWTYRKWNSGIAECWGKWTGTISHYATALGGYAYNTGLITYPTNFFIEEPNAHFSGRIGSGFCNTGTVYNASKNSINCYAISTSSGSQSSTFFIYSIGYWKTYTAPPISYIWHRTMLLEIDTAYDDKGEWVDSGTRIDGHIVYQSEASYNVDDAYDIAKVTFRGYKKFELAIRSYAESTVDYVLVSTLNNDYLADMIFSQQMRAKYNDPTITKAYTRGKQSSSVYEKVLFNNLDPSQEYYFYVIYQKNSSINANDDRGYFYIIG